MRTRRRLHLSASAEKIHLAEERAGGLIKDDRNANGCVAFCQIDLCSPAGFFFLCEYVVERSPAENIQQPFGYYEQKQMKKKNARLDRWKLAEGQSDR